MTFKELTKTYDSVGERIRHMSNGQIVLCTFGMFMFMLLVTCVLYPTTKGMPLLGVPKEKAIVEIQVTDTRKSDETVVSSDADHIYFAKNVTGYLNYSFQKIESEPEEMFISLKYVEADGTVTEILAGENYIFWNGEYRKLMQPGYFAAYVEGVFYDHTVVVTRD